MIDAKKQEILKEFDQRFYCFDEYAIYSKDGSGVSDLETIRVFLDKWITQAVEEALKEVELKEEKEKIKIVYRCGVKPDCQHDTERGAAFHIFLAEFLKKEE